MPLIKIRRVQMHESSPTFTSDFKAAALGPMEARVHRQTAPDRGRSWVLGCCAGSAATRPTTRTLAPSETTPLRHRSLSPLAVRGWCRRASRHLRAEARDRRPSARSNSHPAPMPATTNCAAGTRPNKRPSDGWRSAGWGPSHQSRTMPSRPRRDRRETVL